MSISTIRIKNKLLLAGHSFGSYIGMLATAKAPKNYIAYIGIGQVSNLNESETDSLKYCLEEANKAEYKDDIANLERIRSRVENGDTFVPRKYIEKYGCGSRLTDENGDYVKGYLTNKESK